MPISPSSAPAVAVVSPAGCSAPWPWPCPRIRTVPPSSSRARGRAGRCRRPRCRSNCPCARTLRAPPRRPESGGSTSPVRSSPPSPPSKRTPRSCGRRPLRPRSTAPRCIWSVSPPHMSSRPSGCPPKSTWCGCTTRRRSPSKPPSRLCAATSPSSMCASRSSTPPPPRCSCPPPTPPISWSSALAVAAASPPPSSARPRRACPPTPCARSGWGAWPDGSPAGAAQESPSPQGDEPDSGDDDEGTGEYDPDVLLPEEPPGQKGADDDRGLAHGSHERHRGLLHREQDEHIGQRGQHRHGHQRPLMPAEDLAEVRPPCGTAGQSDDAGGHEQAHAGLGDGEVEQRRLADAVDREVVPQGVAGDESPDQPAPGEPAAQPGTAGGHIPAGPRTDRDDSDSGDDDEGAGHLGEGGTFAEEGHGDDDRDDRTGPPRGRVDHSQGRVVVAGLQGHRIGDVEDGAERGRGDQDRKSV